MPLKVVVIGAVALGPKAACRLARLAPDAQITMVDQSGHISYGGCGIPYYVSGEVNSVRELQSTPYGILRDPAFFKANKGVNVLINTRALSIDRKKRQVRIKDLAAGQESTLPYDKLVLAMGSSANRPPIPGLDLQGVSPATNLEEAETIKNTVASGGVSNAVVLGGGFIGLEMAVALGDMWGIPTSVVELAQHILPGFLSPTLAAMAARDLTEHGVNVYENEKILRLEGENGKVAKVITDKRELDADLVVLSAGVRPNTRIAADAGLELTDRGLIIVDEEMRTSDPDIFAGGDCVSVKNLVTGKPGWNPLGSLANRQGRIIGTNLAGGHAKFQGAVGSWGVKLFDQSAGGAGLSIEGAKREGFDAVNVHVEQVDRAHFYPDHALMALELVVDRPTRRVLGIQGLCAAGDGLMARINPVAAILGQHPVVADISTLEVVYSPPFSSAMDVLNVAGNVAENILEGRCHPMQAEEFCNLWLDRANNEYYFIDARVPSNAGPLAEKYPGEWHNIQPQEVAARLKDIPRDRPLAILCNTGLMSYDAQLALAKYGFTNTRNVAGGMSTIKRLGLDIK